MPQQDMMWDTFISIIDSIPHPSTIILQGEGEPSLHPKFWDMVKYVSEKHHTPETTFNGTQLDIELVPKYFKQINVSIDSLEPDVCDIIGRVGLTKVINNLKELCKTMSTDSITIRTVDFGQSLFTLQEFVRNYKFKWLIQPIQKKLDYTITYQPQFLTVQPISYLHKNLCSYLKQDILRYYTVSGLELPCCFIKDTTGITTIENMITNRPKACLGCDK